MSGHKHRWPRFVACRGKNGPKFIEIFVQEDRPVMLPVLVELTNEYLPGVPLDLVHVELKVIDRRSRVEKLFHVQNPRKLETAIYLSKKTEIPLAPM